MYKILFANRDATSTGDEKRRRVRTGAVKKYNVQRLEPYLEDLRKRKISVEEVAKRVNANIKTVARILNSLGQTIQYRKYNDVKAETIRLKALHRTKFLDEKEFSERVAELLRTGKNYDVACPICKECYSILKEEICPFCTVEGVSRKRKDFHGNGIR